MRLGGVVVIWAALFCVSCSDPYEQTGPPDEIAMGELCVPATSDCPSSVGLQRASSLGANRLDFQLTNLGDPAEISVEALLPEEPGSDASDADASDADGGDVDEPSSPLLVSQSYVLSSGEAVADRFIQEALFARQSFQLRLRCTDCTARLEYVLGSEPLECRSDGDCSGSWLCDEPVGRCVECLRDNHCSETQTCSPTTYRCTPEEASGCAHTPGHTPLEPALPFTLGALALAAAIGCRHRRLVAGLAVGAVLLTAAPKAFAQPPKASLNLGVGSRFLVGKLGDHTKRGIGVSLSQELGGTYLGGRVELGASYFLTQQPPPPLSRELEMYSIALGPLGYIPAGPVEIVVGLDYRHVGVVSNSLVRLTGTDINHSAVGGTVEVRYRTSPFELMLRGGFHPIFGLDSSLFSIDLAVGLTTD